MSARLLVPVVAAFLLATSACGGEKAVSKDAFVAQADAICREANSEREAISDTKVKRGGVGQEEAGVEYGTKIKPVYERALARLKALEVPRGDEETIDAMVAKFEQAIVQIGPFIEAARAHDREKGEDTYFTWGDTAIEGQNIAWKYGLGDCRRFGTP